MISAREAAGSSFVTSKDVGMPSVEEIFEQVAAKIGSSIDEAVSRMSPTAAKAYNESLSALSNTPLKELLPEATSPRTPDRILDALNDIKSRNQDMLEELTHLDDNYQKATDDLISCLYGE